MKQFIPWFRAAILPIMIALEACAPLVYPPGRTVASPHLTATHFITQDGIKLPYRSWLPNAEKPEAVIIALHGFNDYSNFFAKPGAFFAHLGIASYAYDQRGFGGSVNRGLWAGIDAYASDLAQFAQLIAARHPGVPLYLLGESMGGAVIIVAATSDTQLPADGLILAAPAVWARSAMPWYQRLLLWASAHSVPWVTVTGEGLEVLPSDNIEMLRALGRDPLVIKETRIETIVGLVDLMDRAFEQSSKLNRPTLLLYGEKDEIIPKPATVEMLIRMPQRRAGLKRFAFYENGYHMLLRDVQAEVLWKDIAVWIERPQAPLPSRADRRAISALTTARRSN
jgi:alpha-beta hydrolase superfamily lysophospholipase